MNQVSSPSAKAQAGGKRVAGVLLTGAGVLLAIFGLLCLGYFIITGIANDEDGRYMVAVVLIAAVPLVLGAILLAIGRAVRSRR